MRALVLNKADLLRDNTELLVWQKREPGAIPVCAAAPDCDLSKQGFEQLVQLVRKASVGEVREMTLSIPLSDAKTIHTLENRAEVLDREYEDGAVRLRVKLGARQLDQIRSAGAKITIIDPATAEQS